MEYEFKDFVWPGGEKVVKGEPDEYKDVSPSVVKKLLEPLEHLIKKTCYAKKRTRIKEVPGQE